MLRDGDETAGDGRWSVQMEIPVAEEIQYKYTNSGTPGQWTPGEEFAGRNRTLTLRQHSESLITIADIFGQ